jgi:hypothetical protein
MVDFGIGKWHSHFFVSPSFPNRSFFSKLVHLLTNFDKVTSTNLNHLVNTHQCTITTRILDFSNSPNWRETHDTYNQNGQWSCSQIGHLVKMVNVITTYLPNYYNLFIYLPTKHVYLPTYLFIITYVLTYLPTHPHNNCLLQPT